MTRGAIETKIDKTRRAFVQLREQLVAVPPSVPQGLEVLEEIVTTMEELEVAAEELRGQNDELASARLAVEAQCERYRDLFHDAPNGFVVTDAGGVIREANRCAAQLLHVSAERLIGKPLSLFVAAEDRRPFRTLLADLGQDQGVRHTSLHLHPRDGSTVRMVMDVSAHGDQASGRP